MAKRISGAVLAVLVAFGTQAAQGAPAPTIRTVRAMACCAMGCHHAMPAHGASQCCRASSEEQTATVAAPAAAPHVPLAYALVASPPVTGPSAGRLDVPPSPHARGAPVFLLTRSLRI